MAASVSQASSSSPESLMEELWERYPEALQAVSSYPFRHPDIVTPTFCLAPHYGICTGTAVAVTEPHSTYIKVKKKRRSSFKLGFRLLRLLFGRSPPARFLSINDSGELDDAWLTDAAIALFLRATYPRKSRFERSRRLLAPMAFLSPGRSTR